MSGRFVTFEGTDKAGKRTQIRILAETLQRRGHQVITVREPGGTLLGERVRNVLMSPDLSGLMTPQAEVFLFSACRSELVRSVIRPALESGKVVLCERFFDSTLAYQGYGRGLDLEWLREIIDYSIDGVIPDLTLLLQVSVSTSYERRARLTSMDSAFRQDIFEQSGESFFSRVEQGFKELAKEEPNRIQVIDGHGSIKEVAQRILETLERCDIGL
ncbi:MAG: Thymidylate kinase [Verrucomicrobia subdivision 3 bacterium]|nr:Thymidylate kinase [Limisphaerales bacterium]MCS1416023.1 Thymidylate kinase [Limisphaerales bacterium]